MLTRAALLVVAVLTLTGCSSMFAPDPTATPTVSETRVAACAPQTAKLSWSNPKKLSYGLVQSDYETYNAKGENVSGGASDVANGDSLLMLSSPDLLQALGGSSDEWRGALLTSVQNSGLVPFDFGTVDYLVDATQLTVKSPKKGTYARGVIAKQMSVDFSGVCPGPVNFSGTLTSYIQSDGSELTLYCEGSSKSDDAKTKVVRTICDYAATR